VVGPLIPQHNQRLILPNFGARSRAQLATCDPRIVTLFENVVPGYDCTILQGARTPAEQAENVRKGVSKTLDSKHVTDESHPLARAGDAAPSPIVWPDESVLAVLPADVRAKVRAYVHTVGRFYHFAGYVQAKAEALGLQIRWGGDWDGDRDFSDQTFDDLDHFEVVE
jgi:peptidoglycan LD-endopeptidase CwlK